MDRTRFLTTPEEVDGFLAAHENAVLFKAGVCHKNAETFAYVRATLESREDIPLGIIRVVEARAASCRVAELTGVTHESPQVFLFKQGRAVFDRDNWDITAEEIAAAVEEHFPGVSLRP